MSTARPKNNQELTDLFEQQRHEGVTKKNLEELDAIMLDTAGKPELVLEKRKEAARAKRDELLIELGLGYFTKKD